MKNGMISNAGNSRLIKGDLPPTYAEFVQQVANGLQGLDILFNVEGWSQLPTFLNKETLLQDNTEILLFGNAADRTVNEALLFIATKLYLLQTNTAEISVTVADTKGNAVPNVLVQGIFGATTSAVYTNAQGVASGFIAEGSQTIKIAGYADIADVSKNLTVAKGTKITETLAVTRRNFLKVTSSKKIKFTSNCTSIDFTIGGGGGSGSTDAYYARGGAGGGGGYSVEQTDVKVTPNLEYTAIIGAGGAKTEQGGSGSHGPMGNDGGATSFMGATAAGGKHPTLSSDQSQHIGGAGNGTGANNVSTGTAGTIMNNGTNGSGKMYTSYTEATNAYGGGGGCGAPAGRYAGRYEGPGGTGGTPGGGNGGYNEKQYTSHDYGAPGDPGTDGLGGGGGGGAASISSDKGYYSGEGGKGGNGALAIRMHLTIGV